ncbi:MAG: hypothetical protein AUI15_00735 [Actinobacteria bacterium 13_2_20CM_2_66_6]|nr:MAG: hypothetical protein AUI15_00735 [Actinobacteria bacterium 13_2_20CM_2_66_6]
MSDDLVPGLRYTSGAQQLWAAVIASFAGWEQRATEAAEAVGLSPVSAWALVQLDPEHPISQKELAARLTPKGKKIREHLVERLFEPPAAFRKLPARDQARFREVILEAVAGEASRASKRR